MNKITLIVMAAGIGSRFGGGIKQLEPIGPNGELIIDYSIYDAMSAGFNKVVFVIRKEIERDFKEMIGKRIESKVEVLYAYQEIQNISEQYQNKFSSRKKPWGTGQAILCCKDLVKEPFLVINADDYYGKEAYRKAFNYLRMAQENEDKLNICMIGFILKNTLSDNGGVTRGLCKVNKERMLVDIKETHNIVKAEGGACVLGEDHKYAIDIESEVSMNMWGLPVGIFSKLEEGFHQFLDRLDANNMNSEYLLPDAIGSMIKSGEANIKVLQSTDKWFGVTYKEDKDYVISEMKKLIDAGNYSLLKSEHGMFA